MSYAEFWDFSLWRCTDYNKVLMEYLKFWFDSLCAMCYVMNEGEGRRKNCSFVTPSGYPLGIVKVV
jgi:hypothetical protein